MNMNENSTHIIKLFYQLTHKCKYHELEIIISPSEDVYVDGWIGACLRNNLLQEAESINVTGALSLLDIINILPLKRTHPFYERMRDSFPKGYSLHIPSHFESFNSYHIGKGKHFRFSLLLYGYFSEYYSYFLKAIHSFCQKGIGHPRIPFQIIAINECDKENKYPISLETLNNPCDSGRLKTTVRLSDFLTCKMEQDEKEIMISFETPINVHNKLKKREGDEYKDRMHEMPGFHPLVRASANRIEKLMTLYHNSKDADYSQKVADCLMPFVRYSVTPVLTSAQIRRWDFSSTPKEKTLNRVRFSGHTGSLCFEGNFNYYLPLLTFAQKIGVGNYATYGLGNYRIHKL